MLDDSVEIRKLVAVMNAFVYLERAAARLDLSSGVTTHASAHCEQDRQPGSGLGRNLYS